MKKYVLSIFILLYFSHTVIAQEISPTLQNIFKQTIATDGHLTKAMHDKFWKEMKSMWSTKDIRQFTLAMKRNFLNAKFYQKELWESAQISYQNKRVVKTQRLIELEKETILQFKRSLPYPEGSTEYQSAVDAYNKESINSKVNARLLLEAAAAHEPVTFVEGQVVDLNQKIISSVLKGLNASVKRLEALFTEKWTISNNY